MTLKQISQFSFIFIFCTILKANHTTEEKNILPEELTTTTENVKGIQNIILDFQQANTEKHAAILSKKEKLDDLGDKYDGCQRGLHSVFGILAIFGNCGRIIDEYPIAIKSLQQDVQELLKDQDRLKALTVTYHSYLREQNNRIKEIEEAIKQSEQSTEQ